MSTFGIVLGGMAFAFFGLSFAGFVNHNPPADLEFGKMSALFLIASALFFGLAK